MFLKCCAALVSFLKVLRASGSPWKGRLCTWQSDIRVGRRREQYYITESWLLSLQATCGLSFGIRLLSPSFTPSCLHSKVCKPCLEAHSASVTRSTVPVQHSTQWQCGTQHQCDTQCSTSVTHKTLPV